MPLDHLEHVAYKEMALAVAIDEETALRQKRRQHNAPALSILMPFNHLKDVPYREMALGVAVDEVHAEHDLVPLLPVLAKGLDRLVVRVVAARGRVDGRHCTPRTQLCSNQLLY